MYQEGSPPLEIQHLERKFLLEIHKIVIYSLSVIDNYQKMIHLALINKFERGQQLCFQLETLKKTDSDAVTPL